MSNKIIYIYLLFISFMAGIGLIAFKKNWVILNFKHQSLNMPCVKTSCYKKNVKIWFWKHDKWHYEQNDILWGQDSATNITNLVQNWLIVLEEEDITKNKINLQTAVNTQNQQTAYLSFDHSLFTKDLNTYQKLIIIESLLKTLRTNQVGAQYIYFLVQHQLMKDSHLDFNNPWPISGFIKN